MKKKLLAIGVAGSMAAALAYVGLNKQSNKSPKKPSPQPLYRYNSYIDPTTKKPVTKPIDPPMTEDEFKVKPITPVAPVTNDRRPKPASETMLTESLKRQASEKAKREAFQDVMKRAQQRANDKAKAAAEQPMPCPICGNATEAVPGTNKRLCQICGLNMTPKELSLSKEDMLYIKEHPETYLCPNCQNRALRHLDEKESDTLICPDCGTKCIAHNNPAPSDFDSRIDEIRNMINKFEP